MKGITLDVLIADEIRSQIESSQYPKTAGRRRSASCAMSFRAASDSAFQSADSQIRRVYLFQKPRWLLCVQAADRQKPEGIQIDDAYPELMGMPSSIKIASV